MIIIIINTLCLKKNQKPNSKLLSGEVNLTIGGYVLSQERSRIFSGSNPYLQASFGFCFKQSDAYLPLRRLTAPFRILIWRIICVLLLLSMAIILLTKKLSPKWRHFIISGRINRDPILKMWTAVLGNPITFKPNFGNFARTLTLLWILLWLIIRSSYQGALYTYLQSHRMSSPYDTLEKIQASDCKIITSLSGFYFLKGLISPDR